MPVAVNGSREPDDLMSQEAHVLDPGHRTHVELRRELEVAMDIVECHVSLVSPWSVSHVRANGGSCDMRFCSPKCACSREQP